MTVEVESTPNLLPIFGKAALGALPGFGRSGSELPSTTLVQNGVRVDRERLSAYDRVCGFRVSDLLPATFPHILSFPLQAKLMTDPAFPFPMIGLVHLANRITQARPLRADESFVLRVHAEGLRPHERGTQFDMVSEALADGEVVWTDVSTYLRRGGSSGPSERSSSAAPEPLDGEPAARWRLGSDTGRRYAEVSGDHNPIHLYPLTARLFGFKRAIAHGMWSKARCLAFFAERLPEAYTVDVRFKRPILLPASVALLAEQTDGGFRFALRHGSKDTPHLDGSISAG
ncbi:MAG TPA: MaoC/PaaZ C-terminal domain-containing protein [Pseudonocardiaceae bacterium]|nr:MaoC/PaaZ C-terminal domain-containing protein [Pseudonocardiaceae bacterium]